MRYLYTMIAALGLLLLGTMPAAADHAPEWSANGESHVVDETTAHLEGTDTSIETASLGITVDEGVDVTAEYELVDGAECKAGEPRIFAGINGAHPQNNKSAQCDGDGEEGPTGTLSFTTDRAGLIAWFGLVYSPGEEDAGHVIIRNLTVDGEPVHFLNPEPEPKACEWDDKLTVDDEACVEPEDGKDNEDEDKDEDKSKDEDEDAKDDDDGSTSDDDTTPTSTQETLPDTGVSPLWLTGGAIALLLGGYALFRRGRTQ